MTSAFFLGNDKVSFTDSVLKTQHAILLPGGNSWYASSFWGSIAIQELKRSDYSIAVNILETFQNITLRILSLTPGFITTAALKNNFEQSVCGAGKSLIREGQFTSAYSNSMEKYLMVKKKSQVITLDIAYSGEMLQRITSQHFPGFNKLVQHTDRLPVLVGEPYRQLNTTLKEILSGLLYSPYRFDLQKEYIDSLVEEYLYNVLLLSVSENDFSNIISDGDLAKVNKAIGYILRDLDKHYHIREIARYVKMSPTMLKKHFRLVTGKSMYDFLMYHRCLRIADELLNTNKPLKAIYESSGYRDVPAFINGFKRHVGCSPTKYRSR